MRSPLHSNSYAVVLRQKDACSHRLPSSCLSYPDGARPNQARQRLGEDKDETLSQAMTAARAVGSAVAAESPASRRSPCGDDYAGHLLLGGLMSIDAVGALASRRRTARGSGLRPTHRACLGGVCALGWTSPRGGCSEAVGGARASVAVVVARGAGSRGSTGDAHAGRVGKVGAARRWKSEPGFGTG